MIEASRMIAKREVSLRAVFSLLLLSLHILSICGSDTKFKRSKRELDGILKPMNTYKGIPDDELESIVRSYPISENQKKYVIENFDKLKESKIPYDSIQAMAVKAPSSGRNAFNVINEDIKRKLTEDMAKNEGTEFYEVYRGDERDEEEIKAAGGFFGRVPVTVEHARFLAKVWADKSMFTSWKYRGSKLKYVPFVATGVEEAHLGTNKYTIKLPIPKERQPPKGSKAMFIIHDEPKLDDSHIIGVYDGDEVIFITGIPMKYITKD